MRAVPSSPKKAPESRKRLSPRGRGSVPARPGENRLLDLFAQNVRMVRLSKELSQEALADLSDLDRTYISSVERKKRNVSIKIIQRIADALGVDVRLLLDPELASDRRFAAYAPEPEAA